MVIWLRVGDGDGYHEFDTVEDAAQHLGEFFDIMRVWRDRQWGIAAVGYTGNNYISAYWGPTGAADALRDLTDKELAELNDSLVFGFGCL